jgi:large subunit ribosomal protein L32e
MDETRQMIRVRSRHNKPRFLRRGLGQKKQLADVWRRPRGLHNKKRDQRASKGAAPHPGYGSPVAVRGYHPSGYQEVLVFTPDELLGLNPETQAVRIGGSVGNRKRAVIQEQARTSGLKVLNAKDVAVTEEEAGGDE